MKKTGHEAYGCLNMIGIAGFIAILVFIFLAWPAQAQQVCAMRDKVVKMLTEKYQEQPSGSGLSGGEAIVEFYRSEKGTFTIVSSFPNGVACIVAAGNDWKELAVKWGTSL